MPSVIFWHLSWSVSSELPGSVVWPDTNFIHYCFRYFFCPFLFLPDSHYARCTFIVAPWPLTFCSRFYQSFSCFLFCLELSVDVCSSSASSLSCVKAADKLIRNVLCFYYSGFGLQHFLLLFLRVFISLFTVPICFYMLSPFPLEP